MAAVLWLDEHECQQTPLVGAKAANLSRLAGVHQVPPGFAVPAPVAEDVASLRGTGAAEHDVARAYTALAARVGHPDPPVAVRSSAIDEDGASTSFAGQHATYLNVRGARAVIDAIRQCVHSGKTALAQAYRQRHGMLTGTPSVAVLVQALVRSDVSAVVFSANPITGRRDEVLINASWGLGESVVGGTVTPDTYVYSRSRGEIISRTVAAKARMTVLAESGTREVPVPRVLQQRPSLQDGEASALAKLALRLEQHLGWETDVECAYASGELYLLQCRPITTLRA